jgi:uncharacterized membrane protein
MRDKSWGLITSWAFIAGAVVLMACGASPPTATEADAGTLLPDSGTGNETPTVCSSVPAPTTCPDPAPRYADVAPVFERRCVICHAGAPGGPWSLADYGHVADWQDTIRSSLRDCSMPPADAGVPMTLEERTAILTWIRCGLPR